MPSILLALLSVIGLIINITTQILSYRFSAKIGLLKSIILGFIIGLVALFTLEIYVFTNVNVPLINSFTAGADIIAYVALTYCYFHFINLGETARRVRILRELGESNSGLTYQELLQKYNANEIIKYRLNRLLDNGQIFLKDNKYYASKSTVLLISKIIEKMKLFILGKKSEFD